MNRKQWLVIAIGTSILGSLFWILTGGWLCNPLTDGEVYTVCFIRELSFTISAIFCSAFALIFFICARLEKGVKNE